MENEASTNYFHSWAAILSRFYGHDDIFCVALENDPEELEGLMASDRRPVIISYWDREGCRGGDESNEMVVNFNFDGSPESNASGNPFWEIDNHIPIYMDTAIGGEDVFSGESSREEAALVTEDDFFTISYFYDADRGQVRFHLMFDPRTIHFVNPEESSDHIPARQVLLRVEKIIRRVVSLLKPPWANEDGLLSNDFLDGYLLPPSQAEAHQTTQTDRVESLISDIAASFTYSRSREIERMTMALENKLYDIYAARRDLRDREEAYAKFLREIVVLKHCSADDLKESLRAYASSLDLSKLKVQEESIYYDVDSYELSAGSHHNFESATIGPFRICIDRRTLALSVLKTEQTRVSRAGNIHPHINTDGMVCWGGTAPDPETPSGRDMIQNITRRRNVFELLFYAVDFFKRSYNPHDAYCSLTLWRPEECGGSDEEEGWYCDHCEEYHPNDEECPEICSDCGEYVDWAVHRVCPIHGCYDMDTSSPPIDPNHYETAHMNHCPECIEEREAEERAVEEAEALAEQRDNEIQNMEISGGDGDQDVQEQEQEQESEQQEPELQRESEVVE
jgi:hypothetical protein